ncbi:hypothetical protein [Porticoccus sp.]
MSGRPWLEALLRVAVILMVPLMACVGYYAMVGAGEVAVGIARVAGVAMGLVSLLGLVTALWAPGGSGKALVFWGLISLLALLLIGVSF